MTQPVRTRLRVLPILLALAVSVLFAVLALRAARIRTDMTALLPPGRTPAARFLLQELRTGTANRLILIGIEGAKAPALARLSRAMTSGLVRSGRFTLVRDGAGEMEGSAEARFLFDRRYLLSPAVTAAAFRTAALRRDFRRVLAGLQSSAAPVIERFGLADPTGASLALLRDWAGPSRIRVAEGVWFAADRPADSPRALILAETKAGGMDLTAQREVAATIAQAFAAAHPGGARLLLTGTAVLSRAAAGVVRADVERLSILSTLIVGLVLIWRFRSPLVIAAIVIPVVLGLGVAALVVTAVYGSVQGVAFGFGMTMLGVSVDYPVLLIGHRKRGEAPAGTIRRIGRAFALAVATAALGLSGMVLSGFPAVGQLGLFAMTGLLTAALATRFLLPPLIGAADLAPVAAGAPELLLRVERWRRLRPLGLAACLAAALVLLHAGGPRFAQDLASLSPVPAAALARDRDLRGEFGAPDPGQIGLIRAASAEAVLRREEALAPLLDRLRARGAIGGASFAARLLPSAATQKARQAALPGPDVLARRVAAASAGLGFRPGAFAPFLAAVAAARAQPPVTPASLDEPTGGQPVLAARLAPLLFRRGEAWYGVVLPSGVRDSAALAAALRGAGVRFLDLGVAANRIVTDATAVALRWLGVGALASLAALVVFLRDPPRILRVVGAVGAAVLVTLAVLTAAGVRLSLLHIVSLQFVVGVGLDYALFFARPQLDAEERARTLRTLVTCNAMTLLTFGLLAAAATPILRQIGLTVVIGAACAMLFAFLFAGPLPPRPAERV